MRDDLLNRLYFQPAMYETARLIGYAGIETKDFVEKARSLAKANSRITLAKVQAAVDELTVPPHPGNNKHRLELKPEVKRLCWQLLGPETVQKKKSPRSAKPPSVDESQKGVMEQYRLAKERNPGMLLLFRIGDFYETFGEDAKTASKILGLTLISRDEFPMAGFPHHQLEAYLVKLLAEGHRCAICEPDDKPRVEGPNGHAANVKRSRSKQIDVPGGGTATMR